MQQESSSSLRIAMVAACPFPLDRGTPIRIERMARSLGERGHRVDVFTYHHGGERPSEGLNITRIRGARFYRRNAPGPSVTKLIMLDPQLAWRLFRDTGKADYDVIHAHHVEGLLVAQPASRIRDLPVIFDVHALLGSELPFYPIPLPERLVRKVGKGFDRALPAIADHVIAVSGEIEQAILEHERLSAKDVSCIPNGVEDELFPPEDVSAPDHPSIVFAGNFAPYQGIENLLEAFAALREEVPDARLHMLSKSDFSPYRALAEELGVMGAIEFRPLELSELGNSLASCGIAINPRIDCAGLPQKLLNYMAAGCAIVSFSSSAKHVEHDKSALIVPDGNTAAMASAMKRLIDDHALRERLGRNAQQIARNELSWSHAAARIEKVYSKVLEAR